MKKKLLVLGSTGMLGNAVAKCFLKNPLFDVTTTHRDAKMSLTNDSIFFDAINCPLGDLSIGFDFVINCIGVIKPFMAQDPVAAIKINSLFPWKLAQWCNQNKMRLIHITTDCVFSGSKGKYVESDLHDALDDYGKSKSLGECPSEAMILRTSIIGEEIHKNASLIAWAKNQKGKTVSGFSTHIWNGITTNQYAIACEEIIQNEWYKKGLFHLHALDDVTKLQLMVYFNEKFKLKMHIEEKTPPPCDRTLRSETDLCAKLQIPSVRQMVEEL